MPKFRHAVRSLTALSILFILAALSPAPLAASECIVCHGAMQGRMKSSTTGAVVDLHIDAERFGASMHSSLECEECHLTYADGPHKPPLTVLDEDIAALLPAISARRRIDPVAEAACTRCHPSVFEDYLSSVHGVNIFQKKEGDGPLCTDCHGPPHYITARDDPASPVNHANMLETCGNCHEDSAIVEKYGLPAHVIEKYKESFHGKKYLLGHKGVPICNDCHGGHAITRWHAPDSPVSNTNRVKTCARCHEGAGRKFAAAPAHKYIGKENPIPYYGEKVLIVLVFAVFGFTVLHVLLEAFSEIRDHLFTRREEVEKKEDESDDE